MDKVTSSDGTTIAFGRVGEEGPPPNARHHTLERQTHIVKPAALAPVLTEFFSS
jgi:hypothetical protein